eukprot:jgi/Orpsp1_1/1176759/evm.model.c7180000058897.1
MVFSVLTREEYKNIKKKTIDDSLRSNIDVLMKALKQKSDSSYIHSLKVAELTRNFFIRYRSSKGIPIEPGEENNVYYGALLHDIGKLLIPNSILNSSSALTDKQFTLMKTHTNLAIGYLTQYPKEVEEMCFMHHMAYHGSKGYEKNSFRETDFPDYVRMLMITDKYEAITTFDRPYKNKENSKGKESKTAYEAMKELRWDARVDPTMLKVFQQVAENFRLQQLEVIHRVLEEETEIENQRKENENLFPIEVKNEKFKNREEQKRIDNLKVRQTTFSTSALSTDSTIMQECKEKLNNFLQKLQINGLNKYALEDFHNLEERIKIYLSDIEDIDYQIEMSKEFTASIENIKNDLGRLAVQEYLQNRHSTILGDTNNILFKQDIEGEDILIFNFVPSKQTYMNHENRLVVYLNKISKNLHKQICSDSVKSKLQSNRAAEYFEQHKTAFVNPKNNEYVIKKIVDYKPNPRSKEQIEKDIKAMIERNRAISFHIIHHVHIPSSKDDKGNFIKAKDLIYTKGNDYINKTIKNAKTLYDLMNLYTERLNNRTNLDEKKFLSYCIDNIMEFNDEILDER